MVSYCMRAVSSLVPRRSSDSATWPDVVSTVFVVFPDCFMFRSFRSLRGRPFFSWFLWSGLAKSTPRSSRFFFFRFLAPPLVFGGVYVGPSRIFVGFIPSCCSFQMVFVIPSSLTRMTGVRSLGSFQVSFIPSPRKRPICPLL